MRDRVRSVIALIAVTATVVTPTGAARVFDLRTASIADINAAFDAGALTSERLTRLYLARMAGWPEVVVPAGYTTEPMLPVGISFLGPAFSEARLLALGHAFERAYPMRRLPATTPALQGERFEY